LEGRPEGHFKRVFSTLLTDFALQFFVSWGLGRQESRVRSRHDGASGMRAVEPTGNRKFRLSCATREVSGVEAPPCTILAAPHERCLGAR
jgi:hypothetical protein